MLRKIQRRCKNDASLPGPLGGAPRPGARRGLRRLADLSLRRGTWHMPSMQSAAGLATIRRPLVRRVMLQDFRSYATLDLATDGVIVALVGENGAGKTNLVEALSLFAPGRGLRRAQLGDCARIGGAGGFAASILVEDQGAARRLGTGLERQPDGPPARVNRIDGAPVASARAFADHLRVVWLTPSMDGLFIDSASERRRFLDRLVLAIDPSHGARASQLERALRGRNRLLEEGARDAHWLDAIEREAAELAVAVAAARHECVTRLKAMIALERDESSPFPWADLALEGDVERLVAQMPALAAEERYRALLRDNRGRDAAAGRTLIGPHVGDLMVWHGPKKAPAAQASTGEQKALLVGLVLAHARLVAEMSGMAPLALLDEVAAHFDPRRRAALFEALERIGGQAFLTGADPAAFADFAGRALFLDVAPGRVARRG
jgi:DNA replication and repair protein RecF